MGQPISSIGSSSSVNNSERKCNAGTRYNADRRRYTGNMRTTPRGEHRLVLWLPRPPWSSARKRSTYAISLTANDIAYVNAVVALRARVHPHQRDQLRPAAAAAGARSRSRDSRGTSSTSCYVPRLLVCVRFFFGASSSAARRAVESYVSPLDRLRNRRSRPVREIAWKFSVAPAISTSMKLLVLIEVRGRLRGRSHVASSQLSCRA